MFLIKVWFKLNLEKAGGAKLKDLIGSILFAESSFQDGVSFVAWERLEKSMDKYHVHFLLHVYWDCIHCFKIWKAKDGQVFQKCV